MRDPWSASSEIAQAMSAVFARRSARITPSAPKAAMNCVPFTSESPSFACSRTGSRPACSSASPPGRRVALEGGLALADQRQREVRERREVAAGADGAAARHMRQHAAVEALDEQLDRDRPRARVALRQRVRAQQHRRADDLVRVGLADPAGVAAQEAELELLGQLLGDRARDEAAEAGVDAVGVLLAAVRGLLDELAGRAHALARRVREADRPGVDGDLPDVGERQIVARQRLALDHAASLSRHQPGPFQSSSRRSSSTREASKPSIRSAAPAAAAAAPAGIRPTSSEPTTSAPRSAA